MTSEPSRTRVQGRLGIYSEGMGKFVSAKS